MESSMLNKALPMLALACVVAVWFGVAMDAQDDLALPALGNTVQATGDAVVQTGAVR